MTDLVPSGTSPPGAVLIGRELHPDGWAGEKVHYSGPLHMVLFGPNGVGKGLRVLVPNLLAMNGKSVVVIDPKGQLAAMTARWRHQAGNDVKVIDPYGVLADLVENDEKDRYRYLREHNLHKSVGFNPLSHIQLGGKYSKHFYDSMAVLSEALIKVAPNDPHWSESAQGLVTGLTMWECMTEGTGADLANVRRLLTEADAYDDDGNLVAGLRITAAKMVARGERADGYAVADLAARFAANTTSDEMASIRSTADTQLRWLLSQPMRDDLQKDGVDFGELKTSHRPTTVYVILPAEYLETHSIWLRLVVSEALRTNMTMGGRGIIMLLDEFAALGHLSIVQRLFGVTRDFKIQMWPVFQDLPQLKQLYHERWETLLGMAGIVQSFRCGDLTTAEWISKRSGQMQVDKVSVTESESWDGLRPNKSRTESVGPTGRPTILPHDMFGLPEGHTVTFWAGEKRPFMVYAPHLRQTPALMERALPNPYYDGP